MTYRTLTMGDLKSLYEDKINHGVKHTEEQMTAMVENGFSIAVEFEGKLLFACGAIPYWFNRAGVWALFGEGARTYPVAAFRGMQWYLENQPFKRIELYAPYGLPVARRRAQMLGFKLECERAESFMPNGDDATVYSFVRKE